MVSLIAAMAKNRIIGAQNRLPWHLPEDLKYFRRVTSGHPVVMGRKTYESIGRLLPGRENRIVTRQAGYQIEGAKIFHTLTEACQSSSPDSGQDAGSAEVFVIGGAELYTQALEFADRLYLTLLDREYPGDAYFPQWPNERFVEISREDHPGFSFVVLERPRPPTPSQGG
ncbi:dihydrofolate reductase [Bdellovibrionota bacterium FG-1]